MGCQQNISYLLIQGPGGRSEGGLPVGWGWGWGSVVVRQAKPLSHPVSKQTSSTAKLANAGVEMGSSDW